MKTLDIIAAILVIIGGLNWGSIGLFDINFVSAIFGHIPELLRVVYVLVGLGAIYQIVQCKGIQERW